jgi:hypothetical protein
MAIHKKDITVRLGVIYDSQATNRKQGGLPVRAACLLVAYICMTPSRLEYTKTPPETGGSFYILIEKWPKTTFFK